MIRVSKFFHAKVTSLLPNIMYAQMAKNLEIEEVVLCRDGIVTECSSSNIFIVKNGVIDKYTPHCRISLYYSYKFYMNSLLKVRT